MMTVSTAALLLLAQTLPASVPVEADPRHRLDFSNAYVRVFHVDVAPGDSTLFHTHVHDGVGLKLSDARIRDEVLDGAAEDLAVQRGTVSFTARPGPLTHRVRNVGTTRFLNTFVEILPATGTSSVAPSSALDPGWTMVLENARVRVSRRTLAPGQSDDGRAQARGSLRVAISSGTIEIGSARGKSSTATLDPGATRWQEPGTSSSWTNAGDAPFEMVELEVK